MCGSICPAISKPIKLENGHSVEHAEYSNYQNNNDRKITLLIVSPFSSFEIGEIIFIFSV